MTSVVCAVLRPESVRSVALAGDLAELLALPLVLVDIRPTRPVAASEAEMAQVPFMAPGLAVGDPTSLGAVPPAPPPADLEALAHEAGVSPSRCEHLEAPPAAAIESLSAQPDVSLIVSADSGGGPLAVALSGEPPRSALRDLRAPLVLVPERSRRQDRLPARPHIACAVLDDDAAPGAMDVACDLARRLRATLTFVHAGDEPDTADHLAQRVRSRLPEGQEAAFEVLPREDAMDLHAWADARGADLLVTGPPRHGAIVSALLGSVVHTAAQLGSVPVVIAPEGADIA
jgi:nucleotide-binding universal stress UspA family protein